MHTSYNLKTILHEVLDSVIWCISTVTVADENTLLFLLSNATHVSLSFLGYDSWM